VTIVSRAARSLAARRRMWYGEPEQIVLRRWEPDVSLDHAFRCFVHDGRLTAASQYDHYFNYSRYDHLASLAPTVRAGGARRVRAALARGAI